jgi:hypothetical protein
MVSDKLRSLEADAVNYLTAEWPMRHTLSGKRQKACRPDQTASSRETWVGAQRSRPAGVRPLRPVISNAERVVQYLAVRWSGTDRLQRTERADHAG